MGPPKSFESRIDVHNYAADLEQQEQLLKGARMLRYNKDLIIDFINSCKIDPKIGEARIIRYAYTLRRIAQLVSKPFQELDSKDLTELLAKIQQFKTPKGRPISPWTVQEYRKTISKFWRWLYFDDYYGEAPKVIKRIKVSMPDSKREPETYTKEEIKKIINGMPKIRDKAFFACLYDVQCRVGELLSRQIRHVRYTDEGDIQILIEADKTKNSHWETLFESVSLFTTWLRLHPVKDDPQAPLWTVRKVAPDGRWFYQPLTYATARKIFLLVCKRTAIQSGSRNWIHRIRKSKATHDLADGVPITYIENRGSWSKGSRALRECYLAVIQRDKDEAYRRKYGMQRHKGEEGRTELRRCSRCESIIEQEDKFCARCGMPSSPRVLAETQGIDLKKLIDNEILSELVKRHVVQEMKKLKSAEKSPSKSHPPLNRFPQSPTEPLLRKNRAPAG